MTILIIIITCIISFAAFSNPDLMEKYKFNAYKINRNGEHIRWISHGFIHADINHLLFNMITLYFFGKYAESIFMPSFVFIAFYLLAIAISSIPDYIQQKNNPYHSSVGASGAINAVLFSSIILSPLSLLFVMFIIPIPAIIFAFLYLGYSFYMSKQNSDNIGYKAQITGAIFGVIATILYNPNILPSFIEQLKHPQF